jgi:hypothetical protein
VKKPFGGMGNNAVPHLRASTELKIVYSSEKPFERDFC